MVGPEDCELLAAGRQQRPPLGQPVKCALPDSVTSRCPLFPYEPAQHSVEAANVCILSPLSWIVASQNLQHASFLDALSELPLTHRLTGSACVYALQADGSRAPGIQRLLHRCRHLHAQ
jgi:hypothetical protein